MPEADHPWADEFRMTVFYEFFYSLNFQYTNLIVIFPMVFIIKTPALLNLCIFTLSQPLPHQGGGKIGEKFAFTQSCG